MAHTAKHGGHGEGSPQVLLVCPYELLRAALTKLVEASRFEVAAQAVSVEAAADLLNRDSSLNFVLVCGCGADEDDVAFIRDVRSSRLDVRIVTLSMNFEAQRLAECLDAGVDGFLLVDLSPRAFQHSLELVCAGEKVFPTRMAETIAGSARSASTEAGASNSATGGLDLSRREQQLLACLAAGDPNKMIARQLGLTEASVKMHLRQLFRRLGVSNRTQAATWALAKGLAA